MGPTRKITEPPEPRPDAAGPSSWRMTLLPGWCLRVVREMVHSRSVAALVEVRCTESGAIRQHWGGAVVGDHDSLGSALAVATWDGLHRIHCLNLSPSPFCTSDKAAASPLPESPLLQAATSRTSARPPSVAEGQCGSLRSAAATSSAATRIASSSGGLQRVLAVDDDHLNTKVLARQLRRAGLEVQIGEDGEDIINQCITLGQRYDVLLVDEFMSRMSGSAATRELRKFERQHDLPHTPVIITSANCSKEDIERYHSCGANGAVIKPICMRELLDSLCRYHKLCQQLPADGRHDPPNNCSWRDSDPDLVSACGTCIDEESFEGSLVINATHLFGCLKDGQKLDML